jgi:hypothetical protein
MTKRFAIRQSYGARATTGIGLFISTPECAFTTPSGGPTRNKGAFEGSVHTKEPVQNLLDGWDELSLRRGREPRPPCASCHTCTHHGFKASEQAKADHIFDRRQFIDSYTMASKESPPSDLGRDTSCAVMLSALSKNPCSVL